MASARSREVSREKYVHFRDKAVEYYETMKDAHEKGKYNACVSNAVHCVICSVDAFTVFRLGKKSASQNHAEVVLLLKETRTSDESEKSRLCQKVLQLIEMKTPAEYEDRKMSKAESEKAVSLCEKIHSYILGEIRKAEVLSS